MAISLIKANVVACWDLTISQSWFSNIGGLDMRNKVGLQTRYDNVSPVGIYNTVAQQRISTVREDEVKEASAGFYAENTHTVAAQVKKYRWRPL